MTGRARDVGRPVRAAAGSAVCGSVMSAASEVMGQAGISVDRVKMRSRQVEECQ